MDAPIYLDHNATTAQFPEVADAVRETALRYPANPSSQHELGRQARRVLEDARDQIGQLLGARQEGMAADQVLFTSGGTEANNLALLGLTNASLIQNGAPGHLVVSSIEHPCVMDTAFFLQQQGWQIDLAAADANGVVQADQFAKLLAPDTCLASLMLANNETGVLQPVAQLANLSACRRVLVHTDASQVVGKLPVNFAELDVDALCCAAHKFHGPIGIGALLLRHDVPLKPLLLGGHQQAGLRPGTESVALAVGMQMALKICHRSFAKQISRWEELRDVFEKILISNVSDAKVIGAQAKRLPNTSNISFRGFDRQALVMALDQAGVACSTGSACASGSSEPSPVLVAMGFDEVAINGSIRFSLGATTGHTEMTEAARRILNVCKRLRHSSNG